MADNSTHIALQLIIKTLQTARIVNIVTVEIHRQQDSLKHQ